MGRTAIGGVPMDIDKEVRKIMHNCNINYPAALREYVNRKRGFVNWDI